MTSTLETSRRQAFAADQGVVMRRAPNDGRIKPMSIPFDPLQSMTVAADVAMASWAGDEDLATRTGRRLHELIESAVHGAPMYRHLLSGRSRELRLTDMPIVRKAELMRSFDQWCCDPALRLASLRRFVADPANIGRPFLDRYTVWESSGSSGEPALFVQDAAAMAVYDALEALRKPDLRPMRRTLDPLGLGERIVFLGAIGGHFASTVSIERLRRMNPFLSISVTSVSFLQPVGLVVAQLDACRPSVIATYPSAAVLLAAEFRAGRLRSAPKEVWTGGETLTPGMRSFVQEAFGCPVVNSYGASEFLSLACECRLGALHLNSDWAILEPVDGHGRPVPTGTPGTTTLLTNLANHVQPLIRYDLGDRVTLHATPCGCGSHLPVIDVNGRCDDTLQLETAAGHRVHVLPLALSTVLEEGADLFDFQLVQDGPRELSLSTATSGKAAAVALQRGRFVLATFLREQGAGPVRIHCRSGLAPRRGRSGKLQRVIACPG
jgi:phenylacetate-coenzyme A ligase PaaK-like adenylate-forming protein